MIYNYSYSEARKDGVMPPYRLKRIAVPLTDQEKHSYKRFSKKLKKISGIIYSKYPQLKEASNNEFFKKLGELQKKYDDKYLEKFTVLTNQRKSIIHESDSKIRTLKYLIRHKIDPKARIIIFHERTEIADQIYDYLVENDISCTIYHSEIDARTRRENLHNYKEGDKNILVTCRALDEGIDVPDTSVGIIVAATSSVRQRLQRMGRILRKSPGKDYSEIYTIYIKNREDDIFQQEDIVELEKSADKIEKVELDFS